MLEKKKNKINLTSFLLVKYVLCLQLNDNDEASAYHDPHSIVNK